MYEGLVASEKELAREAVSTFAWKTQPLLLSPNPAFSAEMLEQQVKNKDAGVVGRNRPAFTLAFLRRCEQKLPIILSSLHVGKVSLVHLPAESFLEYQLRAQQLAPQRFVAVAAYGDGGPWYIPTKEAYPQGGYEVSVAFSSDQTDRLFAEGLAKL